MNNLDITEGIDKKRFIAIFIVVFLMFLVGFKIIDLVWLNSGEYEGEVCDKMGGELAFDHIDCMIWENCSHLKSGYVCILPNGSEVRIE